MSCVNTPFIRGIAHAKKRDLRLLNHYAYIINTISKALNIYTRE